MVSVLVSSVVDREFEPRSGQNKDYLKCVCVLNFPKVPNESRSKGNGIGNAPSKNRGIIQSGVILIQEKWTIKLLDPKYFQYTMRGFQYLGLQ
jgi:hypothetical protein